MRAAALGYQAQELLLTTVFQIGVDDGTGVDILGRVDGTVTIVTRVDGFDDVWIPVDLVELDDDCKVDDNSVEVGQGVDDGSELTE